MRKRTETRKNGYKRRISERVIASSSIWFGHLRVLVFSCLPTFWLSFTANLRLITPSLRRHAWLNRASLGSEFLFIPERSTERSAVYRSGQKTIMSQNGFYPSLVDAFDQPTDHSLIDLDRCQTIDHQDQSTFDRFLKLRLTHASPTSPCRQVARSLHRHLFPRMSTFPSQVPATTNSDHLSLGLITVNRSRTCASANLPSAFVPPSSTCRQVATPPRPFSCESTFTPHHNSRPRFTKRTSFLGQQTRGGVGNATERLEWGNTLVAGLTAKRFVFSVVQTLGSPQNTLNVLDQRSSGSTLIGHKPFIIKTSLHLIDF